jgi:hypothetical protein
MLPRAAALALAVAVVAASCGGSETPGDVSTTALADASAEIRRDVEASARALSEGRYEDYLGYFSAACRDRIDRVTFAAAVDGIARQFPGFQLTIRNVDVRNQEGDVAEVAVTSVILGSDGRPVTSEPAAPQTAKVVREGGTWVTADCDNVPGYTPS